MVRNFCNDENGFVISAELVLVLTIGVLAMIVGLSEVAIAVNEELNDISNAIGSLNQSYYFTGFAGSGTSKKNAFNGSEWHDIGDNCDANLAVTICAGPTGTNSAETCAALCSN